MTQIELLQFRNAKQFWDEIKKLSPRKHIKIPLEVYGTGNDMIYGIEKVLYKWEQEFMSLYNVIPPSDSEERIKNNKTIQLFI